MTPVCASVSHIEAERDSLGQHFVDAGSHFFGGSRLVGHAPAVIPSAPELAAHERTVRPYLFQFAELSVDVGTGPEVHCPKKVVKSVLFEIA